MELFILILESSQESLSRALRESEVIFTHNSDFKRVPSPPGGRGGGSFIKSYFVPSVAFLEAFDTRFGSRSQCPHSSVSLFHAVVLIPVGTLFLSVSMVFSCAVS